MNLPQQKIRGSGKLLSAVESALRGMSIVKPEKQKEIETRFFDVEEVHQNCTVQVLKNSVTGEQSVGWFKNDESFYSALENAPGPEEVFGTE